MECITHKQWRNIAMVKTVSGNVAQINDFDRRAQQLAKTVNADGAIVIALTRDDEDDSISVSVGCNGLSIQEMLYALNCAIHHSFVITGEDFES